MRKARRRRRTARALGEKRAIIVTGGPGTGKSVVPLQVVGAAAREGHAVVHATGSKAFTTNLRGIVRRSEVFRYFNNFIKTAEDSIDLIVCDEAHRLRETSGTRWNKGTGRPQVGEIIDTAKVAVFFLDHRQSVRGNEIGSVGLIQEHAGRSDVPFSTYDLTTEFRCAGSASYVRWVDHLFGLRDNRSLVWKNQDEYEVRIFDDVQEMEGALRQKMDAGFSARLVAGFCWPWSDPNEDGSLVPDVAIGDWARPWNRKPKDMWRRRKGSSETPVHNPTRSGPPPTRALIRWAASTPPRASSSTMWDSSWDRTCAGIPSTAAGWPTSAGTRMWVQEWPALPRHGSGQEPLTGCGYRPPDHWRSGRASSPTVGGTCRPAEPFSAPVRAPAATAGDPGGAVPHPRRIKAAAIHPAEGPPADVPYMP